MVSFPPWEGRRLPLAHCRALTVSPATINLLEAKQRCAEKIEPLLGPEDDGLAVAIERVKTVAEFVSRAERA